VRRVVELLVACGAFSISAATMAAGDAANGAKLHEDCLGCHGAELYVPPRARVRSLPALKKEVERWNDRMNPRFTKKEIEDIVAYLNATYYRLPR
jgi:mono/diheme cytochrome c family protein